MVLMVNLKQTILDLKNQYSQKIIAIIQQQLIKVLSHSFFMKNEKYLGHLIIFFYYSLFIVKPILKPLIQHTLKQLNKLNLI